MPLKSDLRGRSAEERRTERDELHFLRQPPVRWFEPALLLMAALEVAVSGTFGKFADKRELSGTRRARRSLTPAPATGSSTTRRTTRSGSTS